MWDKTTPKHTSNSSHVFKKVSNSFQICLFKFQTHPIRNGTRRIVEKTHPIVIFTYPLGIYNLEYEHVKEL